MPGSGWLAEADIFRWAEELAQLSTCLEGQACAVLVKDGSKVIGVGQNRCASQDSACNPPVLWCPNVDANSGPAGALCRPVHAPVAAALNIRFGRRASELLQFAAGHSVEPREVLAAFSVAELEKICGTTLYLVSGEGICSSCRTFLYFLGIKEIRHLSPAYGQVSRYRFNFGEN